MDRSNFDPFWNDVEEMNDGRMKCKFCGRPFPKGTSISRIKWHLSREKGHGVAICGQVPKEVQEAALQAVRGGNKRQKTIASSSNVNDNVILSCPQEENNEVDHLAGAAGRIQMAVQGTEQGVGEGTTTSRAEAGNFMENMAGEMMQIDKSITSEELIVDTHESRREASQAPDIVGQTMGRSWDEICNFLMEDDIENGTRGVLQPGAGASSSGRLTRNTNETIRDAVPTTKLVGQVFKDNKKTIWSWLMNDEVSSIGIYGMGGVGKTTLMTHIYNQLLKKPDTFCHVYWITVSQDFSINKLQNSIARHIGLDLCNEEEELLRAVKLSEKLMKIHKWVLILDDLWNYFELHKVGIPVQIKGCKLILTTRSEKVCLQMDSQKKIKVKPLSEEEAWTLFMEKHGHDIALSPGVKKIAQSITEECAGLPLGIITMAGAMKGVDDIHEWRNALEDLKQSRVTQDDMEEKVFRILRFSYMHLKDLALQQCFLYCALFPEDFKISRERLIAYLIDEGVIEEMESREEEFDKGHSMLNRLENVCLLESAKGEGRFVKMHDLIRDMAIQIQQGKNEVMVKAGVQSAQLPDAKKWTESLVRVSLMQNRIAYIPSTYSPRCPNLSTLLLCLNRHMTFIGDSFFKEMQGLKVLDLSYTDITKLPDSVSNLGNLISLLLSHCKYLSSVPSLKNLKELQRLDVSYTALQLMTEDIQCLSKLRYLRLNRFVPSGILRNLSHLRVLIIGEGLSVGGNYASLRVKAEEVVCLTKLETLECYFEHFSEFMEFMKSRDGIQFQSICKIRAGGRDETTNLGNLYINRELDYYIFLRNRRVELYNLLIHRDVDFQIMFPKNIEELVIWKCNDTIRSLCDVSSKIKFATELEVIKIRDCNSMESLVSSSWFHSAPLPLPSYNGVFSSLKEFFCSGCRSIKKLFPLFLLPNLVNLEVIKVEWCEKMEIIATREEESSSCYSNIEFNLPKLRILSLVNLPELKSICGAKLICDSLYLIDIWDCPKLKKMPIRLPLLDHGQPSSLKEIRIHPEEWWESVEEWEHPNAKNVLRRFVKFN